MDTVRIQETKQREFVTEFRRSYVTLMRVTVPQDMPVTLINGIPYISRTETDVNSQLYGVTLLVDLQQAADRGIVTATCAGDL